MDKIIRTLSVTLDLAQISSMDNTNVIEKFSDINFSNHSFLHHSDRSTYIALEIAKKLNLDENKLKLIYLAAQLQDIGSVNSLRKSNTSESFIKQHCIYGAEILKCFPVFPEISEILLYHHENWNGTGPMGKIENEIPIESQILRISDLVEVSYNENMPSYKQRDLIIDWVKNNKDKIFSPYISDAFLDIASKDLFWFDIEAMNSLNFILSKTFPGLYTDIDLDEFNTIALIFSKIIDNKSNFTARHSREIAVLAYNVSKFLGYDDEKCLKMKISGLLHDIGKLAIPSEILDKESALTGEEFSIIKSHVYYTKTILEEIEGIEDISRWASNHHEKLNGNGYPQSLTSSDLSEECRILAVCDIYQALTEDRPYRKGLKREKAYAILDGMVNDGFICKIAVKNLKETLASYKM